MGLFLWTPYYRLPLEDRVEDNDTMADWLHETSTSINVVAHSWPSFQWEVSCSFFLFTLRVHNPYLVLPTAFFCSGLAQVTITSQHQDVTVVEGGNATFQCAGEEDGVTYWLAVHS